VAPAGKPAYQSYDIRTFPRMSVLDALFAIQRDHDRTLAFRCSCRLGMCGTCAVIVNNREGLACQTLVEHFGGREITVRPLNYLPVVKDLAVDLEPFFDRYRAVKPHFVPRPPESATRAAPADHQPVTADGPSVLAGAAALPPAGASGQPDRASAGGAPPPDASAARPWVIEQGEGERKWVDPALGCITCGICHSACSVVGLSARFPGPAALNRAYTLTADVRDGARDERLSLVAAGDGVWRCHQTFACANACPRHLVPTQAIRQLRVDAGAAVANPLAAPLRWLRLATRTAEASRREMPSDDVADGVSARTGATATETAGRRAGRGLGGAASGKGDTASHHIGR
jgi:succinate dehydrogenase/fumarate reductase-like Fe-S protein